MKRLPLVLVAFFTFASCSRSPQENAPVAQEERQEDAPAATPTPPTTPAVAVERSAATATPGPLQNWTAPEGIYFVLRQTSIESAEGLIGLRPGTKVQKQADGRFVTEDQRTVALPPDSVTNDLRVAQRVAAQDQQAQAAIRRAAAAANPRRPASTPRPVAKTETRTTSLQPSSPPRALSAPMGSSLDKKTFNDTDIRRRPR